MTRAIFSLSRRGLMRATAWSGLVLGGLVPAGVSLAAGPEAALDRREGKMEPLTAAEAAKFQPLARGVEAESFAVTLPSGQRHLFRVSGGKKGAATVEAIGPGGATNSVSIMEGDSPVPYLQSKQAALSISAATLSCGGFWACFFPCMIAKVGAGIWNNLKNNWLNCWNQAVSKKYWYQKIAKFLACICSLPYGTYAISCFFSCR